MDLNKVLIAGRLTADPESRNLPSGTTAVEFNIANNRRWKDKDSGEVREDVCFLTVKVFGPKADAVSRFFRKGSRILVEGRLKHETWEKDGKKNSKHVLTLENFHFVDAKAASEAPDDDAGEVEIEETPRKGAKSK